LTKITDRMTKFICTQKYEKYSFAFIE